MAATAPVCNVTVTAPSPRPTSPRGFRLLPPNATLQDVINAFNNNFSTQTQDEEFNRRLGNDINGPKNFQVRGSGQRPQQGQKGQVPKAIDDRLKNMRFMQVSVSRKKIKVTNPKDKEQWIIDDRVTNLVMRDKSGALWVWNDSKSADANSGTNIETTNSGG